METEQAKRKWYLLHDNNNVFYDRLLSALSEEKAREYAKVGFNNFALRLATMDDIRTVMGTSQGDSDRKEALNFQPLFVEAHNKVTMIDILD